MRILLLGLILMAAVSASAAADDGCTIPAPARKTLLLCYDHSRGTWQMAPGQARRATLDGSVPTVTRAPSERLDVRVINTNPLLYGVRLGDAKEEAIGAVAQLKGLFAALAPGLQAVAALGGPPFESLTYDALDRRMRNASRDPALSGARVDARRAIAAAKAEHTLRFRTLQAAVSQLRREFEAVVECRDLMVRRIQRVEQHLEPAGICDDVNARLGAFDVASMAAEESAAQLHAYGAPYVLLFDAFSDLLALEGAAASPSCTDGASGSEALVVCDAVGRMPEPTNIGVDEPRDGALRMLVGAIAASLREIAASPTASVLKAQKARFEHLQQVLRASEAEQKVLVKLEDVLAKSPEMALLAANVRKAYDRHTLHSSDGAVRTWIDVTGADGPVPWDALRTYPLEIAADSPYVSNIALAHAKSVTTRYRVRSATARVFGVGVGVVVTDVAETTYGAVARSPADKELVITETDRTSRSGQLAVLLDYWVLQHVSGSAERWSVRPGLQFGTAVSSDDPAFYGGVVIGIAKYLRVSGGATAQRRKELEGQIPGQVVANRDAIRRRDRFAPGYYISFSFALDSLSLFNAK